MSEQKQVFSWGSGDRGQLGHGDFKDHKHPKQIITIFSDAKKILAVGDTSVILDEFNTIRTFGCNKQGQLGNNSFIDCRNTPEKMGKQFLLDDIVMFKGHYDSENDNHTLSFMNSDSEIFVWGHFDIPVNGSEQEGQSISKPSRSSEARGSSGPVLRSPKPLNFLFDKCLKMKIKSYEISS